MMPERARARAREGLLVFAAFLAVYLSLRSQYYTGDTLYYAHQVDTWVNEQRRIYMFYHFAHILVVPVALAFRRVLEPLFGLDTLGSMGVMAAFFAAGAVGLLYQGARRFGLSWKPSLLLTSALGFSFGFLDYGTVGEDRIQGVFFLTLFLVVFFRTSARCRDRGGAPSWQAGLCTGLLLGLAVAAHLSNGILVPFFCLAVPFLFGPRVLRAPYPWVCLGTASLAILSGFLLVAYGNDTRMESLLDLPKLVTLYHASEQPYFTHALTSSALLSQAVKSAIGIFTAFYYMPEVYLRTAFVLAPWPLRLLLACSFLLFALTMAGILLSTRPRKLDAALWVLLAFWGLHSFFFEAISRADWFPILVLAFFLAARAWAGLEARARAGGAGRMLAWSTAFLPVFLASLMAVNLPHMAAFHREKNPYVRFIEACTRELPPGSLLVLGNSMAISHFDYFRDRYDYPFSVVTFFDIMAIEPAIFFRLNPPPDPVREIDGALREGRPVFVTRRTLEIPPEMYRFLEMEYPRETVDRFLERYGTAPYMSHPYSDLYRVFLREPEADPGAQR